MQTRTQRNAPTADNTIVRISLSPPCPLFRWPLVARAAGLSSDGGPGDSVGAVVGWTVGLIVGCGVGSPVGALVGGGGDGYQVGGGYGRWKGTTFRIGHMGEVGPEDLEGLLDAMDDVLAG